MKAIAINGSPRKRWNTATLLRKALAGAKAKGAMTEFVHLYDLSFRGCISCFACKKISGKSYGRCAVRDELTPLLTKAAEADVLILGVCCKTTNILMVFMTMICYTSSAYR